MQFTFGMLEDHERRKKAAMLGEASQIVDFRRFENLLLKMYEQGGRPPLPPLMPFETADEPSRWKLGMNGHFNYWRTPLGGGTHGRTGFNPPLAPAGRNHGLKPVPPSHVAAFWSMYE